MKMKFWQRSGSSVSCLPGGKIKGEDVLSEGIRRGNYGSRTLVELWPHFVDWEKRAKTEIPFIGSALINLFARREKTFFPAFGPEDVEFVKKFSLWKPRVLDACLGDGCTSIPLIQSMENIELVGNEVDLVFLAAAKRNAAARGIELGTTSHDWRELDGNFEPGSFDALLCLGNSLTYVFGRESQLKVLRNFRNLLKDGGILIIDTRNYDYILEEREKILGGEFRYSGKYVYCGTRVTGKPIEIQDDLVVLEYKDHLGGRSFTLEVYPFRSWELFTLLVEAGFKTQQVFSDYEPQRALPHSRSDFNQYICWKE